MSWFKRKARGRVESSGPVISAPMGADFMNTAMAGGHAKPKEVVFAGHGSFNTVTDRNYPKVRLPPSVTMVFWCHHGEALLDTVGAYVEARKDVQQLPDHLLDMIAADGSNPDVPIIVRGGEEIWNYRLTYPSGLDLGNKPESIPSSVYNPPVTPSRPAAMPQGVVGDRRYCVVPPLSGDIGDRGVPIIALLAGNWNICDGAIVHWCACRSIADR